MTEISVRIAFDKQWFEELIPINATDTIILKRPQLIANIHDPIDKLTFRSLIHRWPCIGEGATGHFGQNQVLTAGPLVVEEHVRNSETTPHSLHRG